MARSKRRVGLFLPGILIAAVAAACSVPPASAIYDLGAIHDMKDWSHKKHALMSHSPFSYFSGVPREGVRIGDLEEFEI
ncbi:MAG: hypothetical protein ACE5H3_09965, partial [Planctomycetota bacterium]